MAGTISDKLVHLDGTKTAIRQAIVDKGVDVPEGTPFRQYADKVSEISGGGGGGSDGWTRPADRPPLPWGEGEITEDNTIYMLFGVMPGAPNDYAITLTGTPYTATWGDGTSNNYSSGTKAEHIFDYDAIDVTPNADGIKWVWMLFRPQSEGSFTTINTNVRHSARPSATSAKLFIPQIYEIYLKATNVSSWAWSSSTYTHFYVLDSFSWYGTNKATSFSHFLYYSYSLKSLHIDTSNGTNFSNFLYNCCAFNQPLNIDTSNGTDFSYFLRGGSAFNQPLNIDTSNGTNFSNFLAYCSAFNQPLLIDTSNGINFGSFLSSCLSFNQPLDNINTGKSTTIGNFLGGVASLVFPVTVNLAAATTAIGTSFIGPGCKSLTGLRLLNMGTIHTALTISYTNMTAAALALLFGDLCNRTSLSAGTITITDSYGAAHLTAEQRAIATSKNWTIVG